MRNRSSLVRALVFAALGVGCVAALFDSGAQYGGFALRQVGVEYIDDRELAFFAFYALWGSLATFFFALALFRGGLAERLYAGVEQALSRPRLMVGLAALLVLCGSVALRELVLQDQPIADDEATYLFEAQTLLHGRVLNPPPPEASFFQNQFVIVNHSGWYGKYPIGHPLVLALGEALGARLLVVPLLGLLAVLLAFRVGCRLFGPRRAALGASVLLISPQFVWTHATQLSQPTSALLMLAGMAAVLRLDEDPRLRWAALAGASFGLELMVRPLPGALFLLVAAAHQLAGLLRDPAARGARFKQLLAAAPFVLAGALGVLGVNYAQTSNSLSSGYASFGPYGVLASNQGLISISLGGALLRQSFWLFGWTFSLAFVPLARPKRAQLLFWGMIAADYAYRVLVPKTVVSTTGPIYVFEAVPLLALATADGLARAVAPLQRLGVQRPRAWLVASVAAASLVALAAFAPVQLRAAYLSSAMRLRLFEVLAARHAAPALVFANEIVSPKREVTWAYYPPNPSPTLDDEIIFVRLPSGAGGPRTAYGFWRRRFPQRRAFLFVDQLGGALLEELQGDDPPPAEMTLADLAAARGHDVPAPDPPGAAARP